MKFLNSSQSGLHGTLAEKSKKKKILKPTNKKDLKSMLLVQELALTFYHVKPWE